MSEEKIHSFYTMLFQGCSASNNDLMLKNNPEIRSLLEESSFRNNEVLEILDYLSTELKDDIAKGIFSFKLKQLYESGDLKLIYKYHGEDFFDELSFEDLLFLLFESKSPLTKNFLKSIERCRLSADSLKEFFLKLGKKDNEVVSYLILDCFLLMGSEVRDDYKFRDALSQWQIWELFNSYKNIYSS